MICLDTDVAVGLLNERPACLLPRFWEEADRSTICLAVISYFELQFGVVKSDQFERNRKRLNDFFLLPIAVLPFETADAEHAAEIRTALFRAGTPIGSYDVLIAAQARCRGATLVTTNTRDFARVPRLSLEDWTAAA